MDPARQWPYSYDTAIGEVDGSNTGAVGSIPLNKVYQVYTAVDMVFVYRIGLFVFTRLCSNLGEVGHHLHAVAREMTTNSVHETLPSFLQRRGSHGVAERISADEDRRWPLFSFPAEIEAGVSTDINHG